MPHNPIEVLTVVYALITGTSAGLLALLSLEVLRHSPIGRAMLLFAIAILLFIIYHILVLFVTVPDIVMTGLPSLMYTLLAAGIWTLVLVERRIEGRLPEVQSS